ncbi:hypothetical protein UNPF46_04640 [Bradyrhizobium sp. UNPF46]|nr:hypothetical protein UNPF46_04640 [Bradyrhizobium sp. UNPF46]
MNIDEEILLNQLAQGIVSDREGEVWFQAHSLDEKRRVLRGLNVVILQASPREEDAATAISKAQLKTTLTPCVIVKRPNLKVQLAKLATLPEPELTQSFRLLIKLLAVADKRRREEKPLDLENHWWHRDLADPNVVNEIKRVKG